MSRVPSGQSGHGPPRIGESRRAPARETQANLIRLKGSLQESSCERWPFVALHRPKAFSPSTHGEPFQDSLPTDQSVTHRRHHGSPSLWRVKPGRKPGRGQAGGWARGYTSPAAWRCATKASATSGGMRGGFRVDGSLPMSDTKSVTRTVGGDQRDVAMTWQIDTPGSSRAR